MALNRRFRDNEKTRRLVVGSGVVSGDPVVSGQSPGVCVVSYDAADGKGTVQLDGSFLLSVKGIDGSGNIAVAVGDIIYYTSGDTPKLNKKTTGVRFGYAEEVVTSGATTTIAVRVGY